MEIAEHGDVHQLIEGAKKQNTSLPESIIWTLIANTVYGMAVANHHKVMHRDIKPKNIVLCGESGPFKIADFGESRNF